MLPDNFSPNTLHPIFSHALSLKLETIKLEAFIQNYSAGQTLAGKVVQVFPEQKALVEFQGEKILLQFPRPVNPGQNIAIKIEQINPSPILKLTELSSTVPSQKNVSEHSVDINSSSNTPTSDKTSIQNRPANSTFESKVANSYSKNELKQLGLVVGQKVKAEVLRIVDRETVQVRFNENTLTIKNSANLKPGDSVLILARSLASGKFVLEAEQAPLPPSTARPLLELSVLKNYLPARQPLVQVLAGLKAVFLDGPSTQLQSLNIDAGQLKELQTNLKKIVSGGEFKAPDAVQLKEIVDRSGFHYEAKIRDFFLEPGGSSKRVLLENDLKGQLMRLARQLEQAPASTTDIRTSDKFIGKLIGQVNQAVSNIELQQLTHHFSKEQHHPILLQLPENLLSEEDRFKVYVLPDQRESTGQESDPQSRIYNLVFLLNLSALGDLRIETKMFKDDISVRISGSNSDAVHFIQSHTPELEDLFLKEGFSIQVASEHQTDVVMEVPDSLGQLLIDTPLQMVDIKT